MDQHGRFIPTHVGHIYDIRKMRFHHTVHPHACGAYNDSFAANNRFFGSSPRMWGIYHIYIPISKNPRFIPTHVGHMPAVRSFPLQLTVHPHACGAYSYPPSSSLLICGSSPRMWGICFLFRALALQLLVHPHACGAYSGEAVDGCWLTGSSPRMWGICRRWKHETFQ